MFLRSDLRFWDQLVVLGLGGSNGVFVMLFSKIQDVQERFKTSDVKKVGRMIFQATPDRGSCLVTSFHYEHAPLGLLTASTTLPVCSGNISSFVLSKSVHSMDNY